MKGKFGPLYSYGVELINRYHPTWFVAENVGGIKSTNEGKAFQKILHDLENSGRGYNLTVHKYKFEKYGIPQARHRIIIVGIKNELKIKFKGKSIADVLAMPVEQAAEFFTNIPAVKRKLDTLMDVGLGYIKLGQSATTLSRGEAQRIKLSKELSKRSTGRTFYILDEPTTGLHFFDVENLLKVLHRFADGGNTVVVIEHNLEVIKTAAHVIDLGPEGGFRGGQDVASGTPEELATVSSSFTGRFLKPLLK